MAQSKSPESAPAGPELNKRTLDFFKKIGAIGLLSSLLLTSGFSIAATYEANKSKPNKYPATNPSANSYQLPYNDGGLDAHISAGMRDVVPGEIEFKLPGVEASVMIPGSEKTVTTQILEQSEPIKTTVESTIDNTYDQSMEWAEQFEKDPSAVEPRGPEAIKDAVERIKELEAQGYTCKVSVLGSSSDDSDVLNGDNPGFGINDEKNVKLAETRAGAVAELFIQDLKDELGEEKANDIEKSIVILGGKEVRDDQLAKAIDEMADKLGMPMDDLVMQFNRNPETLPIEAQELLDGLRQDRFVRIEIKATKQSVVELPSDPEMVTTTTTEKENDREVKIIIIPILIPIFKRRNEGINDIPPTTPPPPSTPPQYPPTFPPKPQILNRGRQFNDTKKIDNYEKNYTDNSINQNMRRKQPRPYNYSQGSTRHLGDRQTRSHGGDAH